MNVALIRSQNLLALVFLSGTCLADDARLLEETRAVAASMPPRLMAVLQAEMAEGGPVAAIAACRDKAPQMAREASAKTGWQIRRVSLKNRNPAAVPDDWEQAALAEFERRAAVGADPATLEKAATVDDGDGRTYRYIRALPTQPLCLTCHGSETEIPAEVKEKLRELYPADRATGHALGSIRGAITVTRPLSRAEM